MKKVLKMTLAAFAFTLFVNVFAVNEANAQGVLQDILNRMQSHKESLQSLKADAKMAETESQFGETTTKTGTVQYLPAKGRDAYVRIDWEKLNGQNYREVLAVANGKYVLYRPKLNQAIIGNTSESQKNTSSSNALDFMNMSKAELKKNYDVKMLANKKIDGEEVWHLELTPKTKKSYTKAELYVNKDGMPVHAEVISKNGDKTQIRLTKIQKNVTIKTAVFSPKSFLPKDVKMVKG